MRRSVVFLLAIASALALLGLPALEGHAQAGDKHPIDSALEACRASASTAGIQACLAQARADWKNVMDAAYEALLSQAHTPQQQEGLRAAQERWLQFKDAEEAYLRSVFAAQDGTIWPLVFAGEALDLYRKRALQLQCHAGMTDMAGPEGCSCP